jgi:hypothetical protein
LREYRGQLRLQLLAAYHRELRGYLGQQPGRSGLLHWDPRRQRTTPRRQQRLCHALSGRQAAGLCRQHLLVGDPGRCAWFRVVPNDLKRYNFNNHSPLQKEADGSLKIAVGPKPVSGVAESNWLPSAEGKPFSLTFRTYVPKEAVQKCEWTPPPLAKVN